ncbi:MAG: carbohydrate kinase [Melioribacter sp.]|uniref:carbohydrate kinase family protein n=1 Tax=Rosettibacter primus TaxID=3111523 RepID=UPI00247CB091|nr:carbohydrate kinase [Melioribacter sp.]
MDKSKICNITAIGEILYDIYPNRKRLGGAPFNFIYHVWKILGKANFISSVGNDENGKEILSYLNSIGFDTKLISVDNYHPTGTVKVELDENKIPHFTISSECCYDFLTINNEIINIVENNTDILYFGTLSQRSKISRKTIQSLFGKNIKYFCDLNLRHNFFSDEMIKEALKVSNVIKINYEEFNKIKKILHMEMSDELTIENLCNEFNIDLLSITLGNKGAILYDKKSFSHYKTKTDKVVDTVGAGDAFAAILCIGYLFQLDLYTINKLANEFATEICMIEGAVPEDDSLYEKYRKIFGNNY